MSVNNIFFLLKTDNVQAQFNGSGSRICEYLQYKWRTIDTNETRH